MNIYKTLIIFCLLALSKPILGQTCGSCSITISTTDTSSYIVSSGQTLCIDSNANVLGKITVNGGTICNKGFFNPSELNLNSGTINNYSNITFNSSLSLPSGFNLLIGGSSIINLDGDFTIQSGNVTNNGFVNVTGNIQNNSGTVTNNNVINCSQLNGTTITNYGIVNLNQ